MSKIKTYFEYINESNSNKIINVILDTLEPTILDLVNRTEKHYLEKLDKTFTEYDREITRLTIIFDMVKSIEKYTSSMDSLISINSSTSRKGNLQISAEIQRGQTSYNLNTEVIIAGGYNIQVAHYRYITLTNLPQTGQTEIAKEYSDKIKKMSKLEKLNNEIQNYKTRIDNNNDLVAQNSKFTDYEIYQKYLEGSDGYIWPTWEEIVKRGADKNYNNDEDLYIATSNKGKQDNINSWKIINIHSKNNNTKDLQKRIDKLEQKIKQSISNI